MGLQDTPRGNRLHIGLFGRRNAGERADGAGDRTGIAGSWNDCRSGV